MLEMFAKEMLHNACPNCDEIIDGVEWYVNTFDLHCREITVWWRMQDDDETIIHKYVFS